MIWSLCETSQRFLFLKVIHLGVFPPLSPRQMSHIKSLCVYVCLSVCCGLLNGHSRWWKAPRQASVGLEHTPSGKPQHLLYQPMTAWPCRLLAPFLCLSVSPPPVFLSKEADPLNFLTNFRCPGSAVKGLFLCRKIKCICSLFSSHHCFGTGDIPTLPPVLSQSYQYSSRVAAVHRFHSIPWYQNWLFSYHTHVLIYGIESNISSSYQGSNLFGLWNCKRKKVFCFHSFVGHCNC